MTVSLLFPIGLAAAVACLLPLLIHLARRSEHRLVMFAAFRWLQAKPRPKRKYRFEQILLLLLRLLLLLALALLLAAPVLFGRPDLTTRVLVAPGTDVTTARRDIGMTDAHWYWLAPGFPVIDDEDPISRAKPAANRPSLTSLLREFDATIPAGAALTVLVPPVIVADAERPVLSRTVDWHVVQGQAAATPPATDAIPALMVRHSPGRAAALRYLRAAGEAWAKSNQSLDQHTGPETVDAPTTNSPVTIAPASQPLDPDSQRLVWLVPGPLPDPIREWIIAGGVALLDAETTVPELADAAVLWRGPDGPLAVGKKLGNGRIMRLQNDLVPEAMPILLDPDFPIQLQRLLAGAPPLPARVSANVHTALTGAADYPEVPRPLAPWLAILVALLFLIERWVANGPRRSPAS